MSTADDEFAFLEFLKAIPTESLRMIFNPALARQLNGPLADFILRSMAFELIQRGDLMDGRLRSVIVGPERCRHGRSRLGTCGACDGHMDGYLVLYNGEPEHVFVGGGAKERAQNYVEMNGDVEDDTWTIRQIDTSGDGMDP